MTGKMETPFYHDDSAPGFGPVPEYERYPGHKMMSKKNPVPQNFPGAGAGLKLLPPGSNMGMGPAGPNLPSPDIGLLKLGSPDLEHLILQSPGSSGGFYRSQATNEQEGFADGFVKALADLHKQNQLVGAPMSPPAAPLQGSYQRPMLPAEMPVYTNLSSYSGPGYGPPMGYGPPQGQTRGPDTPQTVPEADSSSPPALSPIDLETQERIKAERKKLRNRIAASKCRKRKLERISRLEEKVKLLKTQNSDLASTAGLLREQVAQLKQKVMNHVTNGCQIAVTPKSGASA